MAENGGKIFNGGPAFPCTGSVKTEDGYSMINFGGMSLRDYFAAAAMQGYCTNKDFSEISWGKIAEWSYMQSDAMLKERQK